MFELEQILWSNLNIKTADEFDCKDHLPRQKKNTMTSAGLPLQGDCQVGAYLMFWQRLDSLTLKSRSSHNRSVAPTLLVWRFGAVQSTFPRRIKDLMKH